MDKIINLLKQYKQVFLYRHINPDYDAFGSTVGMYYFLKENFPEINVVLKGNFENVLWEKFNATIDEEKELPILGIVILYVIKSLRLIIISLLILMEISILKMLLHQVLLRLFLYY